MNDKDYIDILTRHGVPMPPSWGGLTGSGGEQMYSLGGRWLKAGQKTPQGHTIDSLDPDTGFLNLSYQGVPLMPLKMRDAVVQDYIPEPTEGGGGETDMDKQRMENLFKPMQNDDGTWSVPHFGKQVFETPEEAQDFVRKYGVQDRTGVDKFIKSFKDKKVAEGFGTLADFWKLPPDKQAAGMKVFNNETGDFTDTFKAKDETNIPNSYYDPTLDIPFGNDGYIK